MLSRKHIMLSRKHIVKRSPDSCLPPCILGLWLVARILMPFASVERALKLGPQSCPPSGDKKSHEKRPKPGGLRPAEGSSNRVLRRHSDRGMQLHPGLPQLQPGPAAHRTVPLCAGDRIRSLTDS